jgi:hypothetical protein
VRLWPHERPAANMTTNLSGSIGYEARPAWVYDFRWVVQIETMRRRAS